MPLLDPSHVLDVSVEQDRAAGETSDERFDRVGFAMQALELVRPQRTTVVVCEGARMRVEQGRAWGRGAGARWAVLAVPPTASRRAIARAVAELARAPRPWVMDVLMA